MKINETFISLQGEGHFTGTPAFFLRLSGCNLQCPFCDTNHQAFREMSEDEIVREASRGKPRHISTVSAIRQMWVPSSVRQQLLA